MYVNILTRTPFFANFGTSAVPLSMYVLMETHMKWVPRTSLDKDAVRRLGQIRIYIRVKLLMVLQMYQNWVLYNIFPWGYM